MKKLPPTKKELQDFYHKNGCKKTLNHYNISNSILRRWLLELDIPPQRPKKGALTGQVTSVKKRKNKQTPIPPRDELLAIYKTKGRVGGKNHYGVSHSVFRRWLLILDIPLNFPIDKRIAPGDIYYNLTAVEQSHKNKYGQIIWKCKCKCGNECLVPGLQLKNGRSKGCGCLNKTGYMGLSGTMFSRIRTSALRREYKFETTAKYLWEIFEKQNRKCAITGIPLDINNNASLDRIDNNIGYIPGNV